MLSSALAFLAGICLLVCCQRLPDTISLVAAALLVLPAWYWRRRLSRWPALVLAGGCWAAWHTALLAAIQLPPALEGQDLEVRGQVTGMPERLSQGHVRLRFRVDAWRHGADWQAVTLPVRLNWYRGAPPLRAGERWQLQVRLKRPHGLANPGGFEYERWLFGRAIRATGYVRKHPGNARLAPAAPLPWQRLRRYLLTYLQQSDLPSGEQALLRALALGDRAGISRQQWQRLQHTGTSHLLAISGLHVGLVASLVFLLTERLWRWLGGARWFPAPRAAALAAMLAALVYALLSGFQVPAQRATLMICLWMGATLATGEARPWPVFGLALLIILLHAPLVVLTAGFWLSFGAVALILFLSLGRHGGDGRRQGLRVQLGLVAGLTPLLWLWFQQAPLVAPLANLVAVPWVSFLVIPPLLLALLLMPLSSVLADSLLSLAALSLHGVWQFLRLLDFGDATQWQAPPLGGAGLVLFALGLLTVLLPAATGIRRLALLLVLPALTASSTRPAPGDVWLTLLDVGQGLAIVVETGRHLLVYDTGPAFPGGFDSGSQVLVPFLRQRGYRHLDRLVISHSDNDHSGGGESLYRQFPATRVEAGEPAAIHWTRAAACRQQPAWQWDGVTFEYLVAGDATRGNNASCVLKITPADDRSLLLPGDIEQPVETALVETHGEQLAARVLVAPHHGSATSSGRSFISAVDPDWVLLATGYRNRFGFPRPDVMARYTAAGVRAMNTATAGAVTVHVEAGHPIQVTGWRQQHPRLWQQGD